MCQRLGVTRGGFYSWEKRKESKKNYSDLALLRWIKKVHRGRRRCYGSPRVYKFLKRLGVTCRRQRVARVMRENGIKATVVGLYYYNPNRRVAYQKVANVLASAPAPQDIDQQWVADFTYLKTKTDRWVYLATVMDAYSRKVVGWSVSKVRDAEFTGRSLAMALRKRTPLSGAIFHTDQGCEYVAEKFQEALRLNNFTASMSGKGRCLDNAMAESFFHTFKTESYYQRKFKNMESIRKEFISYLDFYNNERLHSSLNYMSPKEFEKQAA